MTIKGYPPKKEGLINGSLATIVPPLGMITALFQGGWNWVEGYVSNAIVNRPLKPERANPAE